MQTRIIKTCFWDDPKVRKLDKNSKYLLLYFLSNRFVGMSNYYEASLDSILGDTKLNIKEFDMAMNSLRNSKLADYYLEWVYIPNLEKHNKYKESPKNLPTYVRQLDSVPKHILEHYKAIEDTSIYSTMDTTMHSSTIVPINNKYKIINHKEGGVGETKTSKNSLLPCTNQELEEVALDMGISLNHVKSVHDSINDKIAAKEFKYKTVYYTLRNWLRLSVQKGQLKQDSAPVYVKDPRLLEIEKSL